MINAITKLSDAVAFVVEVICSIMVAIIASILLINVVGRFIFSFSFPWAEEVARYLIIWVAMLITSNLIRNDELIKVDFFDLLWSPKLIKYRSIVYRALMFALFFLLVQHGWTMAVEGRMSTLSSVKVTWFWPYLSIPVGCALMLFQLTVVTILDFNKLFSKKKEG